jgi:hypothetical protein
MTEHHDLVRRYPDFDSLTRGYFYPDRRLHWSTVYEVYDAAFADFGEEGRRDLRGEVEQILDAYRTDEEVLGFLEAMHVTFNPERRFGLTLRAWLEDLRDRLPESSRAARPPTKDFSAMSDRYPGFMSLMTASFNVDWQDDFADVEAVLQSDVFALSATYQRRLRDQIDEVLLAHPTDDDLQQLLSDIGSGFSAAVDAGTSEVAWFTALRSRLDAAIDTRRLPDG